ncbi:MAG: sulfotransferase domain-containing protein [Spirulinaceae cyanobacterium]
MINLKTNLKKNIKKALTRFDVRHKAVPDNIYHCCVQKTASQWVKSILSDPRVYKYSGLVSYNYEHNLPQGFDPRNLHEKSIQFSLPTRTIVSPLYLDFVSFQSIPKPKQYKAFFISRDPRDIVVSWYFSMKYSHAEMALVKVHRDKLNSLSLEEGLIYCIKYLNRYGIFQTLKSWQEAQNQDANLQLIKYEDITGTNNLVTWQKLFAHLDIPLPEDTLLNLLQDYSFKKLSGGRKPGEENQLSHYRKGTPGDWRKYFKQETSSFFRSITGDLTKQLNYTI